MALIPARVDPLVSVGLNALLRRSVAGQLRGVWVRGAMPTGAAIIAPNHHSWWDGYVLHSLCHALGHRFRVLMTGRQLTAFPYLRRVGALPDTAVRPALREAQTGAWVVVFAEGQLRPAGPLGAVQPGAGWLARRAGVPLVPVALRVVMRGQQQPEAYLRFGRPVGADKLQAALAHELTVLDAELLSSDPEQPLAGYLKVVGRGGSQNERLAGAGKFLAWVTGERMTGDTVTGDTVTGDG